MTYLYAGLGIVMLTGIMAIFQMSVAMVSQQSTEQVKSDTTAQSFLPLEKTILTALASKRGQLMSCEAVKDEINKLATDLTTMGCKGSLMIYVSKNGDYRLGIQWIDQSSDPEIWSCGRSTSNAYSYDKTCEMAMFAQGQSQ